MAEFSKQLIVGTDVAHIVIFHPDDLVHASEWPIAWYSEAFVFPAESSAGRLIAWCTGSDGGFAVRLTDGPMTDRERQHAGPEWTFPYSVRHGCVYLDNTDALPGVEKMTETSDREECWIDVPNGDYAVTVTAVEWNAEPGTGEDGADTLPNYVVRFEACTGQAIAPARRPPDLVCLAGSVATDTLYKPAARAAETIDLDRPYPAFVSTSVARAGQSFSTTGEAPIEAAVPAEDGDKFALFDVVFVVAADLTPGAPAVIAGCRGTAGDPDGPTRYSFYARQAVRIAAVEGMFRDGLYERQGTVGFFRRKPRPIAADALAAVRIAPLPLVEDAPPTVTPEMLQARVVDDLSGGGPLARRLGGIAGYEALRLATPSEPDTITNWLIDNLPLSAAERLRTSVLPLHARCSALSTAYEAFRTGAS